MAHNRHKKVNNPEKDWLNESPFICLPRGTKRWIKSYLSRRNRRTAKKELKQEVNQ